MKRNEVVRLHDNFSPALIEWHKISRILYSNRQEIYHNDTYLYDDINMAVARLKNSNPTVYTMLAEAVLEKDKNKLASVKEAIEYITALESLFKVINEIIFYLSS